MAKLVFAVEPLEKVWDEIMAVASLHWQETEGFRRGEHFAPSYARYIKCERIGFFRMYTARDGTKLCGYAGQYVTNSMHSQARISVEDQWFLLPEYRKGRNALAFVKFVEDDMLGLGVTNMQMSAKISNGIGKVLEYLGYEPISTVYFKSITKKDDARAA